MDEGHDGSDIGGVAVLCGAVEVRMSGDVGKTRPHKPARVIHLLVIQLRIVGDQYIVGMLIVNQQPHLLQLAL